MLFIYTTIRTKKEAVSLSQKKYALICRFTYDKTLSDYKLEEMRPA